MIKYKVILQAEDGDYVLKDGFNDYKSAERYADSIESNYGEGQMLCIDKYAE